MVWTIIFCVLIAYAIVLYRITGKNRDADKLMWAFGSIALAGFIIHMVIFCNTADNIGADIISMVLFSIQYSLEMFIANTIIFKPELEATLSSCPCLYHIFTAIYGAALLTSGFAIFHFLPRRIHNWLWLTTHKEDAKNKISHIFVGINSHALYLAEDIVANPIKDKAGKILETEIIFIDLPDHQDNPQGISVWDIIARFFKVSKETELLDNYVVLKSGKGLSNLKFWLQNEKNKLYILSDSEERNLSLLEQIWENKDCFKCTIYCHAKKEGLVNRYDNITDIQDQIKFIDSSFLAVQYLKKHESDDFLPVKYVDIPEGVDSTGTKRKLAYVSSSFNCAVIGFGETGKEAVKFLYEFGALPGEDNKKVPFQCHIFDANIDKEIGEFGIDLGALRAPGVEHDEFVLHSCDTRSNAFRETMSKLIPSMNYIIVCLGNDDLNIETAINLAEFAEINERDTTKNFCIAVKQTQITKLNRETIDKANEAFNKCIHTFGMDETIWKRSIISDEEREADARRFFESYTELSKTFLSSLDYPIPTWEERESLIRSLSYEERTKARRQKAQDYSNTYHKTTKRILCQPHKGLSDLIYAKCEGEVHCDVKGKEILEHLAVGEHLRWEASHLMLGYKPTPNKNDRTRDLKKLHNSIRSYYDLSDVTQHFDWLVVKNSLS
jgi:hypothetical protein